MNHCYYENKNRYVELENFQNIGNQTGGKKNKLMFIMFPGFGTPKSGWDVTDIDKHNRIIRTNFITELKKMGEVYFYSPPYNNFNYYDKKNKYRSLYDKNIDFSNDDFNIPLVC